MRYSGGPIVHRQIDAGTWLSLASELKNALVDAGWSSQETTATASLSFSGQPLNTQTCEVDYYGPNKIAYAAKNTPSGPYDFQIGATKEDTATNLATIVASTHPTATATVNGAVVTFTNRTSGGQTDIYVYAPLSNTSWTYGYHSGGYTGVLRDGGYKVTSVLTPQGLQMKLHIYRNAFDVNTHVRVRPYSFNESASGTPSPGGSNACGEAGLTAATGRLLEVIAGPHYVWVFLLGSSGTGGTVLEAGTPYIRSAHTPKQIVDVADSGGEFEVETAIPHGRVTGEHVFIDRALGVSGLNGDWQVTVVDQYKYTLDGSTYAAGYTANSGFTAGPQEISRCIYLRSCSSPGATQYHPTFRNSPFSRNYGGVFVCLNQYAYSTTGDGLWGPLLQFPMTVDFNGTWRQPDNWGPYADIIEPRLSWAVSSQASTHFTVGELWDAFILCDAVNKDVQKINFDGYNWINYMDNYTYMSLWLATGVTS